MLPNDANLTESKAAWKKIWRNGQHQTLAKSVMKHIKDEDASWAADVFQDILFSS